MALVVAHSFGRHLSKHLPRDYEVCFHGGARTTDFPGIGGPTLEKAVERVSTIVLVTGANDVLGKSPRDIVRDILQLCKVLRGDSSRTLLVSEITPRTANRRLLDRFPEAAQREELAQWNLRAAQVNEGLRAVTTDVPWLDLVSHPRFHTASGPNAEMLADDGLHMSFKGTPIFAQRIRRAVEIGPSPCLVRPRPAPAPAPSTPASSSTPPAPSSTSTPVPFTSTPTPTSTIAPPSSPVSSAASLIVSSRAEGRKSYSDTVRFRPEKRVFRQTCIAAIPSRPMMPPLTSTKDWPALPTITAFTSTPTSTSTSIFTPSPALAMPTSAMPTSHPTGQPTPTPAPSTAPDMPTRHPTGQPTSTPIPAPAMPTGQPTPTPGPSPAPAMPTSHPTGQPTYSTHISAPFPAPDMPISHPTGRLTSTLTPTTAPSSAPNMPINFPTRQPTSTRTPTFAPSSAPDMPIGHPTGQPTSTPTPTTAPSPAPDIPISHPTGQTTSNTTSAPSPAPDMPISHPTGQPTAIPTHNTTPSAAPAMSTSHPTAQSIAQPTSTPTTAPCPAPTCHPTGQTKKHKPIMPFANNAQLLESDTRYYFSTDSVPLYGAAVLPPTLPTCQPTDHPTGQPTGHPTDHPTDQIPGQPTAIPALAVPVLPPTMPTGQASGHPTGQPTGQPTDQPTDHPTDHPTGQISVSAPAAPAMPPPTMPTGKLTIQPSCYTTKNQKHSLPFTDMETRYSFSTHRVTLYGGGNDEPVFSKVVIFPTSNKVATILDQPHSDLCNTYPPVRPDSGSMFVFYDGGDVNKRNDWRKDGYTWRHNGINLFTAKNNKVIRRTYYNIRNGNETSNAFQRQSNCYADENYNGLTIVTYMGDASAYKGLPHGNLKGNKRAHTITIPSCISDIKNTCAGAMPNAVFSGIIKGEPSTPLKNRGPPIATDETLSSHNSDTDEDEDIISNTSETNTPQTNVGKQKHLNSTSHFWKQEAMALKVINDRSIVLVPEMGAFMVRGSKGRNFVVTLFPAETCSCPFTYTCVHIKVARLAIGLDQKVATLRQLRTMNTLLTTDNKCGTKISRKGDDDGEPSYTPGPDSAIKTGCQSDETFDTPTVQNTEINSQTCEKSRKKLNFNQSPKSITKYKNKMRTPSGSAKKRKLDFETSAHNKKIKVEHDLPELDEELLHTSPVLNTLSDDFKAENNPDLYTHIIQDKHATHVNADGAVDLSSLEDKVQSMYDVKYWLPDLGLTKDDRTDLIKDKFLNSRHMEAVNILLRKQFGESIGGLQLAEIVPSYNDDQKRWIVTIPMETASFPSCQIHHTHTNHWVCSIYHDNKVYLLDSLNTTARADDAIITNGLKIQLAQIYGNDNRNLKISVPNVTTQTNSVDCGLFAIAFVTSFCRRKDLCLDMIFDSVRMREHLLQCFVNHELSEFPITNKTLSKRLLSNMRTIDIPRFCICNLPECVDNLVQCDKCNSWYHVSCVDAPPDISSTGKKFECRHCDLDQT